MGSFARKYGKCTGSEAWALVYPSATSFGLSALPTTSLSHLPPPPSLGPAAQQVNAGQGHDRLAALILDLPGQI